MILAEANVSLNEIVQYFGDGDRMHMLFGFLINQYTFLALARENADPLRLARQRRARPAQSVAAAVRGDAQAWRAAIQGTDGHPDGSPLSGPRPGGSPDPIVGIWATAGCASKARAADSKPPSKGRRTGAPPGRIPDAS